MDHHYHPFNNSAFPFSQYFSAFTCQNAAQAARWFDSSVLKYNGHDLKMKQSAWQSHTKSNLCLKQLFVLDDRYLLMVDDSYSMLVNALWEPRWIPRYTKFEEETTKCRRVPIDTDKLSGRGRISTTDASVVLKQVHWGVKPIYPNCLN